MWILLLNLMAIGLSPLFANASSQWLELKEECNSGRQKIQFTCEIRLWHWDFYGNEVHRQLLRSQSSTKLKSITSKGKVISETSTTKNAQLDIPFECPYIAQEEVLYSQPITLKCSDLSKVVDDFDQYCRKSLKIGSPEQDKFEVSRRIIPSSVRSACVNIGIQEKTIQTKASRQVLTQQSLQLLKQTGKHIVQFEESIQQAIEPINSMNQEIKQSRCNTDSLGKKCQELKEQTKKKYVHFLNILNVKVLGLEQNLTETTIAISNDINTYLNGTSLGNIQKNLSNQQNSHSELIKRLRERNQRRATLKGVNLSQKFAKLLSTIQLRGQQNTHPLLMASDINISMKQTLEIVQAIKVEIHNSQIMLEFYDFTSIVSENWNIGLIESIHLLLFGNENDESLEKLEPAPYIDPNNGANGVESDESQAWIKGLGL